MSRWWREFWETFTRPGRDFNSERLTLTGRTLEPRLTAVDLRRARTYASRPDMIEGFGAAEWINALLDHIEERR